MNKNTNKLTTLCVVSLASMAAFTSGCASIVHGGNRNVTIASIPAGAKVSISKVGTTEVVHSALTPCTVSLSPRRGYFKGQSYNVRFELAGYKTDEITLKSELSGWYLGNIIFGGLIGMLVVDPATGSMWNITPDKIERTLSQDQAAVLKSGNGFIVTMISEATAAEKAAMVRIN